MAEVLVVDDDDEIRELIAMRVRRAGHRVTSLGDPSAALAVATATHVDLALLDWSMPVMDGGQLCERLRALPHLSGTPILVVTAHSDADTRRRASAAGASGYLTKPFSVHELDHFVAAQLASHADVPGRVGA